MIKYKYIGLILLVAGLLRFWQLNMTPPSPYWEEVALGYDAYSIKQTLKDHHGNFLPLVAFESFGDWKPALYFYAIIPFLYIFDLSVFAVRLPSVIAGVMMVWGVCSLAKEFRINPYIAGLVVTLSPWAIMFSRAAWEVNLATALIVWGMVYGIRGLLAQNIHIGQRDVIISALLLGLSAYTYHAARIIAPLLFASLVLVHFSMRSVDVMSYVRQYLRSIIVPIFILIVLLAPIIIRLQDPQLNIRFQQTSIFTDISVIQDSNLAREINNNSIVSRIFHHRYLLFSQEILNNFLSHFSLNFLFVSGDTNPRHSVGLIGHLYYIELPFLLLGAFTIIRRWQKKYLILLLWLVIGVLPSSISHGSPHALRILPTMPVFMLLISYGIQSTYQLFISLLALKRLVIGMLIAGYALSFSQFWHYYQNIYPIVYASEWQYGYEEMVEVVAAYKKENPEANIYITREQGRPAMYYFFYTKTNPNEVQSVAREVLRDQGELLQFGKIKFIDQSSDNLETGDLIVSSEKFYQSILTRELPLELKSTIYHPNQSLIWLIYSIK